MRRRVGRESMACAPCAAILRGTPPKTRKCFVDQASKQNCIHPNASQGFFVVERLWRQAAGLKAWICNLEYLLAVSKNLAHPLHPVYDDGKGGGWNWWV